MMSLGHRKRVLASLQAVSAEDSCTPHDELQGTGDSHADSVNHLVSTYKYSFFQATKIAIFEKIPIF